MLTPGSFSVFAFFCEVFFCGNDKTEVRYTAGACSAGGSKGSGVGAAFCSAAGGRPRRGLPKQPRHIPRGERHSRNPRGNAHLHSAWRSARSFERTGQFERGRHRLPCIIASAAHSATSTAIAVRKLSEGRASTHGRRQNREGGGFYINAAPKQTCNRRVAKTGSGTPNVANNTETCKTDIDKSAQGGEVKVRAATARGTACSDLQARR